MEPKGPAVRDSGVDGQSPARDQFYLLASWRASFLRALASECACGLSESRLCPQGHCGGHCRVPEHRWGKGVVERAVAVHAIRPPPGQLPQCVWGSSCIPEVAEGPRGSLVNQPLWVERETAHFFDLAGSDLGLVQKWREGVSCAGGANVRAGRWR